ncbi:MAG: ubiquinone biosynthesis protein UbiB [Pelagibacteraceae bacterium]|nr:ubiquinone biosynthesis protein UbiB [Pelagibacteraceae bacterium]PHX89272.1 MAG: ubiquinone biosynthesis protein UbiB [Pelagibacteraceae bacterium]
MYHLIFIVKIKNNMKVCILGGGISSLALAKALVKENIYVDNYLSSKDINPSKSRTIGISRNNVNFFNRNIINIEKILWKLNRIEVFTDNLKSEKLLNFKSDNDQLFSILKNYELYQILNNALNKNKFFKKKIIKNLDLFFYENYNLVINCDHNHFISIKYFSKKIEKIYNCTAYTTIIKHKKLANNFTATQIFTKNGPLAFLPISDIETSVVYSANYALDKKDIDLKHIIQKYNNKYLIEKIDKIDICELQSLNLRSYYYKNILAFGDLLHRLHPLAGQGFNMTIRDIRQLLDIIKNKINLGLSLDSSINIEFEEKIRHKNFVFSNGIDFVHEFFNIERKVNSKILSKAVQFFGKIPNINKIFVNLADAGF